MKQLISRYKNLTVEIKAALWFAMCNFLTKGIAIIVVPIYTRLLSTSQYGEYTVFQSWLNIFIIIATLEISRGHYKVGITRFDSDVNHYTSSMLGLGNAVTVLFIVVYLLAPRLFNRFLDMPTGVVIGMFIYLLVYPAWEFWTINQRFSYKYKTMVIATSLIAILSPIIGIVGILFFDLQSKAAIFSKLIVEGLFALLFYISFIKKDNRLYDKQYWKIAFTFNITLLPYLLSTSVLNQADRIMIKGMIGSSEAAIYSVAYSIAMVMQLINAAVSDSFIPWMYRKLKEHDYNDIEPATNKLLILIAGFNLLVVLFAPEVISIFAPADYIDAIWIIPPVTASVFFMFLFQRYVNVEVFYGSTSIVSATSIIIAILNVLLNYVCILKWGYLAAGYTTLFCYVLFCIVHYINLKRIYKINCNNQRIFTSKFTILISILFLAIVFIIMMLYNYRIIRYALAVVICCIAYYKKDYIIGIIKSRVSDR